MSYERHWGDAYRAGYEAAKAEGMSGDEITVTLTREEANGLLHAWACEEFPDELRAEAGALARAEAKLRAALEDKGRNG